MFSSAKGTLTCLLGFPGFAYGDFLLLAFLKGLWRIVYFLNAWAS